MNSYAHYFHHVAHEEIFLKIRLVSLTFELLSSNSGKYVQLLTPGGIGACFFYTLTLVGSLGTF